MDVYCCGLEEGIDTILANEKKDVENPNSERMTRDNKGVNLAPFET